MSQLPEGWIKTSFGKLVESMKNGLYKPKDAYAEDGIACLRMYNIDSGKIVWKDIKRMKLSAQEVEDYQLLPGDLLVNRVNSRELVGKAAVIPSEIEKCVFESKNIRVRLLRQAILPEIANYQLLMAGADYFGHNAQQVVGMASISQPQIASFSLFLPPIAEQRRIVAKLEMLLGKVDACQQRLEKVPVILKRFRQAVLAAACAGELTVDWRENHEHSAWETKPLGELITDPKNGYSAKPVGYQTAYQVLTLTATTSGRFNPEYFKYFDEHIPVDSPLWLKPDDILVQRGNTIEYVGVSAIYDGEPNQFVYPDLMIKFRAKDVINTKFLYLMLSWERTRNYFRENATGTAGNMPKINQKVLVTAPIDVPSKPEQHEIVRRVEALFKLADQLESRYQKAKAQVDKLQQSILAKAFRGELVPTEAKLARHEGRDYEPAAALLERIRAAHAEPARQPKKKTRSQPNNLA